MHADTVFIAYACTALCSVAYSASISSTDASSHCCILYSLQHIKLASMHLISVKSAL
jgi:hypothetical protein